MIKDYQIDTILDYAQDWFERLIVNADSPHLEDKINCTTARELLKDYILETLEIKKDD